MFLNGYDVATNTVVQMSVSPTNLQGTNLTIKLTLGPYTNIRRGWFSWVAFSPADASFGSFGGQVAENNFKGDSTKDVSNSLYYSPYRLYGLNLISLTVPGPI